MLPGNYRAAEFLVTPRRLAQGIGAAALAVCLAATAQTPDPERMNAAIAAATQAAGSDMQAPLALCDAAIKPLAPTEDQLHAGLQKAMAGSYLSPVQVFDNLYFLGTTWVSAWALKTSGGIILFDALDNDAEAQDSIEDGLRQLGLDPATIRYIVVTHAHGDHYGGVDYLVSKYHPRVVMSEIDWDELAKPKLQFDDERWGRPPPRDLAVHDGAHIKLGTTTVELYVTAGHTPGTISAVFPVADHGHVRTAVLWGGTSFNFGHIASRLSSYIASADRFEALVHQRHIEVLLSNHPPFDQSLAKMKVLVNQGAGQPNPYVIGEDATARFMKVAGLCARATLLSFDSQALDATKK